MNSRHYPQTLTTLLGLLILSLSALAQQPAFLTNGLVTYYPFDGNVTDFSGNSFHGIDYSITPAKDRWDNKSGSIAFDGRNSFIEVPSFSSQKFTGQLTISFWFNENVDHDGLDHYILSSVSSSPAYSGFDVAIMTRTDEMPPAGLWFREFGGRDDGTALSVCDWKLIQTNVWHNAIYVLEGTSAAIYLDGKLISPWKSSMPFKLVDNGIPLLIGKGVWRKWLDSFYNGLLDDLRIYNRALSSGEVAALYQYESVPQKSDPRQATAAATVVNGFVVGATVTDGGRWYTKAPKVVISGGGGTGATATATIDADGRVTRITIVSSGSKYTGIPIIIIESPPFPPSQAKGTASLINGFVTGVNITDSGHGYEGVIPPVTFIGGGGSGAKGIAIVSNGVVTGISMTASGSSYTKPPYVLIAAPPGLARAEISVHSVDVTLHLIPGYTYKIQTAIDAGSTWVDVETGILAVDATLVRTFDVTTTTQLFRVVQVN